MMTRLNGNIFLRAAIAALAFFFSVTAGAQMKMKSLEVPAKGSLTIPFDTVWVDNFVIREGATLILGNPGSTLYIKAGSISIAAGAKIMGNGAAGEAGARGKDAAPPNGVCKDGIKGVTGATGSDGVNGKNLYLDVKKLEVAGPVEINLSGGNGGEGGEGGSGSTGAKATAHCVTNGGDGGEGGIGGKGGDGGTLTLNCETCVAGQELLKVITLTNAGGYAGYGGYGGKAGFAGQGSSGMAGKTGKDGARGTKGTDGTPLYHTLIKETAKLGQ